MIKTASAGPYRSVVSMAIGAVVDAAELLRFEEHVRLPFSGAVAAWYSRRDAAYRKHVDELGDEAAWRGRV